MEPRIIVHGQVEEWGWGLRGPQTQWELRSARGDLRTPQVPMDRGEGAQEVRKKYIKARVAKS